MLFSARQNTEHLGRIRADVRNVNEDLSMRVVDLRRRFACCNSDEEAADGGGGSGDGGPADSGAGSADERSGMLDVCIAAADQVRCESRSVGEILCHC